MRDLGAMVTTKIGGWFLLFAVVTLKKEVKRLVSVKKKKVKGPLCWCIKRLTSSAAGGQTAENQAYNLIIRMTGMETPAWDPLIKTDLATAASTA